MQQININGPVFLQGQVNVQIYQGPVTIDNRTEFTYSCKSNNKTSTEPSGSGQTAERNNTNLKRCLGCVNWDILLTCFKDIIIASIRAFTA